MYRTNKQKKEKAKRGENFQNKKEKELGEFLLGNRKHTVPIMEWEIYR